MELAAILAAALKLLQVAIKVLEGISMGLAHVATARF